VLGHLARQLLSAEVPLPGPRCLFQVVEGLLCPELFRSALSISRGESIITSHPSALPPHGTHSICDSLSVCVGICLLSPLDYSFSDGSGCFPTGISPSLCTRACIRRSSTELINKGEAQSSGHVLRGLLFLLDCSKSTRDFS
jgi:hypothetical protein